MYWRFIIKKKKVAWGFYFIFMYGILYFGYLWLCGLEGITRRPDLLYFL